ncbi:type VII secretion-associated serine protease mycosin [Streptomyces sp. SBR177]
MALTLLGVGATPAHAESVRDMQWHLDAMKAEEMWKVSQGEGVVVAVIDSGVDDTIPDLRGQVLPGKDYSKLSGDENNDVDDHGTGMAAAIAGTGARGPQQGSWGLAPKAKILPIRIAYNQERWQVKDRVDESFSQGMATAIRYAADSRAKIINISVGDSKGKVGPELEQAVRYALSKNKLIFAAVGNTADADNEVQYPSATPGVVGVGGLDRKAAWWPKSQTGPQVDLAAPADTVVRACSKGTQLCTGSGTSAATALASASAALIWAAHPDWTNNQVLRVMLNTAGKPQGGKERTDYIGYGAIRPRIALSNPGDPGPADVYPLPDLAAAGATATPAPTASPAPDPARPPAPSPAAAAPADDGGNTGLWVALGVGAALLVGGAVTAALVRSRRRTSQPPAQAPLPPAYAPYGAQQQPPYGPGGGQG